MRFSVFSTLLVCISANAMWNMARECVYSRFSHGLGFFFMFGRALVEWRYIHASCRTVHIIWCAKRFNLAIKRDTQHVEKKAHAYTTKITFTSVQIFTRCGVFKPNHPIALHKWKRIWTAKLVTICIYSYCLYYDHRDTPPSPSIHITTQPPAIISEHNGRIKYNNNIKQQQQQHQRWRWKKNSP